MNNPTEFQVLLHDALAYYESDGSNITYKKTVEMILSAVSELVRECKPNSPNKDSFWQQAIDEYEKNLLEALDPVSVTKAIENDSELTSD